MGYRAMKLATRKNVNGLTCFYDNFNDVKVPIMWIKGKFLPLAVVQNPWDNRVL